MSKELKDVPDAWEADWESLADVRILNIQSTNISD
jgi:hypothetical protein